MHRVSRDSLCIATVVVGGLLFAQQGLPPRAHTPPLANLSDSFSGTTLDPSWQLHNPQFMSWSVGGGELHLEATVAGAAATWFNDNEGPMLYKSVTGDFDAVATVRAWSSLQPALPPPPQYRLGGLLARDPASAPGNRSWVHVAVGAGDFANPVAFEDKTTLASQSHFLLYPTPAARGQLRIRRSGVEFRLYARPDRASPWQLLRTHLRPDLPATLQVGPMVYSNGIPADVGLSVDEIAFR